MQIIISPAKKMNVDTDSLPCRGLPAFLPRTERLLAALRAMDSAALKRLWKCNDQIAALNLQRLASMDLRRNLTPALLSYEGIQYQYMAPAVFTDGEYDYVQAHLRILSGFYGLLRPFDGVTPYRLEMQARLAVDGARDLYAFWGDSLARQLLEEKERSDLTGADIRERQLQGTVRDGQYVLTARYACVEDIGFEEAILTESK